MAEAFQAIIAPVTPDAADAKVREVLKDAGRKMGFIPNLYTRMANHSGLLQAYLSGYERFRRDENFTAVEQEVVLLTISRENSCTYCVAAHSTVADMMSKVPAAVTEAVRNGTVVPDTRLEALRNFTQTMMKKMGRPDEDDARAFFAAGYNERHILAVILAIGVKTFSNYTNHVFHTPLDAAFQSRAWCGNNCRCS